MSQTCKNCGAEMKFPAPQCWLCREPMSVVTAIEPGDEAAPRVPSAAPSQVAVVGAIVLFLLALAFLFSQSVGLAVAYAIFVTPALIALLRVFTAKPSTAPVAVPGASSDAPPPEAVAAAATPESELDARGDKRPKTRQDGAFDALVKGAFYLAVGMIALVFIFIGMMTLFAIVCFAAFATGAIR